MIQKLFVSKPRIEIVLVPGKGSKIGADGTVGDDAMYETWLVWHEPDGKAPTTAQITPPHSKDEASQILDRIYTVIREHFGFVDDTGH